MTKFATKQRRVKNTSLCTCDDLFNLFHMNTLTDYVLAVSCDPHNASINSKNFELSKTGNAFLNTSSQTCSNKS